MRIRNRHAGYEKGYMFFYDETENSQKIVPENQANARGLFPDKGDFHVGVLIGCRMSHVCAWMRKLQDVEDKIRIERSMPSGGAPPGTRAIDSRSPANESI